MVLRSHQMGLHLCTTFIGVVVCWLYSAFTEPSSYIFFRRSLDTRPTPIRSTDSNPNRWSCREEPAQPEEGPQSAKQTKRHPTSTHIYNGQYEVGGLEPGRLEAQLASEKYYFLRGSPETAYCTINWTHRGITWGWSQLFALGYPITKFSKRPFLLWILL